MSRTTSLDRQGVQERSVGETAVVAVLSSLGLVAGAVSAVTAWAVVGGVPIAGYAIALGVALGVAVGLPAGTARLGRTVFGATTRSDCDPEIGRAGRPVSPTEFCGD